MSENLPLLQTCPECGAPAEAGALAPTLFERFHRLGRYLAPFAVFLWLAGSVVIGEWDSWFYPHRPVQSFKATEQEALVIGDGVTVETLWAATTGRESDTWTRAFLDRYRNGWTPPGDAAIRAGAGGKSGYTMEGSTWGWPSVIRRKTAWHQYADLYTRTPPTFPRALQSWGGPGISGFGYYTSDGIDSTHDVFSVFALAPCVAILVVALAVSFYVFGRIRDRRRRWLCHLLVCLLVAAPLVWANVASFRTDVQFGFTEPPNAKTHMRETSLTEKELADLAAANPAGADAALARAILAALPAGVQQDAPVRIAGGRTAAVEFSAFDFPSFTDAVNAYRVTPAARGGGLPGWGMTIRPYGWLTMFYLPSRPGDAAAVAILVDWNGLGVWVLTGFAIWLSAYWLWRLFVWFRMNRPHRRRRAAGCCVRCGYDLKVAVGGQRVAAGEPAR